MSEKIYLRDVGSHPERDLEVTLFRDGELQFEADNGKYVHININKGGVEEIVRFLNDHANAELKELIEKWNDEGRYNQFIAECAKELTDVLQIIRDEL